MKIADETIAQAVDLAASLLLLLEDSEKESALETARLKNHAALLGVAFGGKQSKPRVEWETVREL